MLAQPDNGTSPQAGQRYSDLTMNTRRATEAKNRPAASKKNAHSFCDDWLETLPTTRLTTADVTRSKIQGLAAAHVCFCLS
jgi:hypothetical protein